MWSSLFLKWVDLGINTSFVYHELTMTPASRGDLRLPLLSNLSKDFGPNVTPSSRRGISAMISLDCPWYLSWWRQAWLPGLFFHNDGHSWTRQIRETPIRCSRMVGAGFLIIIQLGYFRVLHVEAGIFPTLLLPETAGLWKIITGIEQPPLRISWSKHECKPPLILDTTTYDMVPQGVEMTEFEISGDTLGSNVQPFVD